jgi:hypothetical protein
MGRLILMLLGLVLLALVHPPLLLASLAAPRPPIRTFCPICTEPATLCHACPPFSAAIIELQPTSLARS